MGQLEQSLYKVGAYLQHQDNIKRKEKELASFVGLSHICSVEKKYMYRKGKRRGYQGWALLGRQREKRYTGDPRHWWLWTDGWKTWEGSSTGVRTGNEQRKVVCIALTKGGT